MSDDSAQHPDMQRPSAKYGSAKHPERGVARTRPSTASDATVEALGKISQALEAAEHARGLLYGFHRLTGTVDLTLQEGVRALRDAGRHDIADEVESVLVGRDVIEGMWTFQIIEAYDRQYWSVFHDVEQWVRAELGLPRHLVEAEMKHREQDGS